MGEPVSSEEGAVQAVTAEREITNKGLKEMPWVLNAIGKLCNGDDPAEALATLNDGIRRTIGKEQRYLRAKERVGRDPEGLAIKTAAGTLTETFRLIGDLAMLGNTDKPAVQLLIDGMKKSG